MIFIKIDQEAYNVITQSDVEMDQQSLLFQVSYPETMENISHNCFMFTEEQREDGRAQSQALVLNKP